MKETIKLTRSDVVEILDQTKLPFREKIIATTNYIEIIKAIKITGNDRLSSETIIILSEAF